MNKKHIAGIASLIFVLAEFGGFLLWGFNIHPGDEMGYGLIVIYAAMPLTALILGAVLSAKKSVYLLPAFILKILSHIFLPFIIYGTFEIALSICLSAIPFLAGSAIGFTIYKSKNK